MKKKILIISVILIAIIVVTAFTTKTYLYQNRIPIQGQISSQGELVNGSITFQFEISDIEWSETHYNVQVVNGLWSTVLGRAETLPNNMWQGRDSIIINISANGTQLTPQVIYPPITREQNKSVKWSDIDSIFQVGQPNIEIINDTLQKFFNNSISTNEVSQGFVPNQTGNLIQLGVVISNANQTEYQLKIFEGTDITGQAIYQNTYPASSLQTGTSMQTIEINSQGLQLQKGDVYTFMLTGLSNDLILSYSDENPYPQGNSSIGANADLAFVTVIEVTTGIKFATNENNDFVVVDGRFRDKTGATTFAGEIKAFAGTNIPDGWLICNGAAVNRIKYPDLFESIQTNWGAGDGINTYRLPDLRGRFLRGVNAGSGVDPNANARWARYPGGATGDNVGSYQEDIFKNHQHLFGGDDMIGTHGFSYEKISNVSYDASSGWSGGGGNYRTKNDISNSGGSETRPDNAYVIYIIKY